MSPIKFRAANTTYAKDQPEYMPLPAFVDPNDTTGRVISCWQLTWRERVRVLFAGKVWLSQLTFRQPLQPQSPSIVSPFNGVTLRMWFTEPRLAWRMITWNWPRPYSERPWLLICPRPLRNWIGRRRGYGSCLRCNDSWIWAAYHVTPYDKGGCFPLCEPCWKELGDPVARWPFYQRLIDDWARYGCPISEQEREALLRSVAGEGMEAPK